LTKQFRSGWLGHTRVTALDGLSLSVRKGEIYGFLGPNGAGKTTTFKILLGLMRPSGGRAEILGRPAGDVEVRARVGFLPEAPYFYDYLTAEEFLTFYGQLAGLAKVEVAKRVERLLEVVGLTEARHRQLRKLSRGMLQRVGLAQALIHDPELVLLDEPMSGLDPVGRIQIRNIILGLRDQGKTVFFSSHIIPDVEMICDRVGIVVRGKLVASGRVEELIKPGHTQSVEVVCQGIKVDDIPAIRSLASRIVQRERNCLMILPGVERLDDLLGMIKAHGGTLVAVTPHKGSLEELFLQQASESDRKV
jgi:ABC-2 type transport system ATP-binding protein